MRARLLLSLFRAAFLSLPASCASSGADAGRTQPQLLRLEAKDLAFAGPATVPAGPTRVRLVNRGRAWHEALITRLPEGATVDMYIAGARAGEAFPVAATDIGGPGLIATGDSAEAILPLRPGRYAIVCWSADHVKAGMIVPLTVTAAEPTTGSAAGSGADGAVEPLVAGGDAVLDVVLREYRFEHAAFRRGRQVLRVRNEGRRPHNMQLYRLDPGRTLRDFGAWFATRQGAAPATPMGGTVTLAPGHTVLVPVTLAPGRYFVACGTPEGNTIHARLGMVEEFEIP